MPISPLFYDFWDLHTLQFCYKHIHWGVWFYAKQLVVTLHAWPGLMWGAVLPTKDPYTASMLVFWGEPRSRTSDHPGQPCSRVCLHASPNIFIGRPLYQGFQLRHCSPLWRRTFSLPAFPSLLPREPRVHEDAGAFCLGLLHSKAILPSTQHLPVPFHGDT